MIDLLNYIVWNPDLEVFRLGPLAVRWYGLMWIIGLALAYFVASTSIHSSFIASLAF